MKTTINLLETLRNKKKGIINLKIKVTLSSSNALEATLCLACCVVYPCPMNSLSPTLRETVSRGGGMPRTWNKVETFINELAMNTLARPVFLDR